MTAWLTSPALFYAGMPVLMVAGIALMFWVQAKTTPKEPVDDPPPDLRSALERLLRSGYDRAFAAIGFEECEHTIQVRKYIHAKGDCGLELRIALGDAPSERRQRLLDICERRGAAYTAGPEVADEPGEFLFVDLGTDIVAASGLVDAIAVPALAVTGDARPYWILYGLCQRLRVIDDPRQKPPDGHGLIQRMNEISHRTDLSIEMRSQMLSDVPARHGQSTMDGLWALLWFLTGAPALLALLYALPWKLAWRAEQVEPILTAFEITLFGVTVHPYRFDLVCLSLIVVATVVFRQLLLMRVPARRLSPPEKVFHCALWYGIVPAILLASLALWIV